MIFTSSSLPVIIKLMKKFFKFIIIFLVISGWIFSGWPTIWNNPPFPPKVQKARADTIADSTPGTVASVADAGTGCTNATATDWGTMTNTTTSNDAYAIYGTGNFFDASQVSEEFQLSNFGILIPDGSTINGITVDIERKGTPADIQDRNINLTKTAGVQLGTNKAVAADWGTTDATATYGSGSDVWGTTWNEAEIEATGFGLVICVQTLVGDANGIASIDFINVTITYTAPPATFLGNDTDPGANPTIAPGAATTTVGTFNLKTSSGTDTIVSATTTLSIGSSGGLFGVEITSSDNATIYCASYNPASDTVELFSCNLPVTTASTTFNIRIKPKTHSAMPPPSGSTYSVTATITSITGTNSTSGIDTTSDTVTIDNASPNGATVTSGSAGNAQVTLNWIASNSSSDFDTTNGSVILRWASGSAGSEVPQEGKSDYTAGNTITTATVACVISSAASASLSKIDGSGGDIGCTTDALTNGWQYTYVAFQRDTNGNYDAGASIGTFTPQSVSLTFTIDTNNVFIGTNTPGTPVASSSVLTVNTNNSTGYNITINRASTTPTLFLTGDVSITIPDTPNGNNWTAPTATSTAGASAIWTSGTTKGLGFRVKQTGTVSNTYSSTWWGTSDAAANALYSGISTSTPAQKIANTTLGSGSNENTVVEYKLDGATTQKSGSYVSSPITFTATTNP